MSHAFWGFCCSLKDAVGVWRVCKAGKAGAPSHCLQRISGLFRENTSQAANRWLRAEQKHGGG